jgi:hypothetical protein
MASIWGGPLGLSNFRTLVIGVEIGCAPFSLLPVLESKVLVRYFGT